MKSMVVALSFLLLASVASAVDMDATLAASNDVSREDAGGFCANEQAFVFDAGGSGTQLLIAGDTAGCDHEWGAFAEFLLPVLGSGATVTAAEFRVRKMGHSDNAPGLPYLGVFSYDPAVRPVSLLRSVLSPTTAQAIQQAPVANTDMSFDVTSLVQGLYTNGDSACALFLCGVTSEVGYETLVFAGGPSSATPPRLIVTAEIPVRNDARAWSAVKALYR